MFIRPANLFIAFRDKIQSFKSWAYRKGVDTAVKRIVVLPFVTAFSTKTCLIVLGTTYVLVNTVAPQTTSEYLSPVVECLASYTIVGRNLDLICDYSIPVAKTVFENTYPVIKIAATNSIPVVKAAVGSIIPLSKGLVEVAMQN